MATKKTAAAAKKTIKKAPAKKSVTSTKVTTVTPASKGLSTKNKSFSFSRSPILAASIAEFVGTALLATVILATKGEPLYILFTLVAIVLTIGAVSGAHVNPVVTIGAWATKRIDAIRAVSYLVAQVLGALVALVIANAYLSSFSVPAESQQAGLLGQAMPDPSLFKLGAIEGGKEWLLLAAEFLGGALFGFGVASFSKEKSRTAVALGVGGSLFLAVLVTSYLTGLAISGSGAGPAVLNPAIAFTLQGVTWSLWPIAIYLFASPLGAVLGFVVRDLISVESDKE